MLDKLTNIKTVVILIVARLITGMISMPSGAQPSLIEIAFSILSTLLMILILVIALHALGNYSKRKGDEDKRD